MKQKRFAQGGFHVIELSIVVLVLAIVGFIGFKVFSNNKAPKGSESSATAKTISSKSNEPVKWAFSQKELKWITQTGTAPACKSPFTFDQSPVDLSKIMVVGMPGAYRGYNYKPHGGMRLADMNSGNIDIKMPIDATLTGITRYYEGNPSELQYLLNFETPCGIAFRFDHVYTLTPALQKIADTTPVPKKDDTRVDPNVPFTRVGFKSGDVIATAVGFPHIKNFGFDFGVYDYRNKNEISKNAKWASIHNTYQSTEWYGACWPDMLPGTDKAKAKELSLVKINPAKPNIVSDYCSYAPHTTLDFNGGQPTDG